MYVIIQAKQFLYPLAFGFLLAYLLYPAVNFLEKHDVPRILSIIIGLVIVIAIIYGAGFFIFRRIGTLVEDIPSLKKQALDNVDAFVQSIQITFGIKENKLEVFLRDSVSGMFQTGSQGFKQMFVHTTGTLIKILLLPVYVFSSFITARNSLTLSLKWYGMIDDWSPLKFCAKSLLLLPGIWEEYL